MPEQTEADIDAEIAALLAKRASIKSGGGAVVGGNASVAAGGLFVGRDYLQLITQHFHAAEQDAIKHTLGHYLDTLVHELSVLKLDSVSTGTADATRSTVQLADVYVPLDTTQSITGGYTLREIIEGDPQGRSKRVPKKNGRDQYVMAVSALEALAYHRSMVLLGKPGSGKSTFAASVLLALAQAGQDVPDALQPLGKHWTHGALLPIRVVLRRFAETLPEGDAPARAGDVWRFIAEEALAQGAGFSPHIGEVLQHMAREGGALFVLDGLDECSQQRRPRVQAALDELQKVAGPRCRFLTCARPYAWGAPQGMAHAVYSLADLDEDQIKEFITRWYAAMHTRGWLVNQKAADDKRDDLQSALARADLRPILSNPLLLTLVAILHTNTHKLPDDRVELYHQCVELLMQRWNAPVGMDEALLQQLDMRDLKLSHIREVLEGLAFDVHAANEGRKGVADLDEHMLLAAFREALGNSWDKAQIVVNYIEQRAGLLIAQGAPLAVPGNRAKPRQYSFPHRTFQEYLAACHLRRQKDFAAQCVALAERAPDHWQVVLPLAARVGEADAGPLAADALIGELTVDEASALGVLTPTHWRKAWLAGIMLQEIGSYTMNKHRANREIKARAQGWLLAGMGRLESIGGLPARQRAQMGDALAAIGDPRFDPGLFGLPKLPMLGFVHVPADPSFIIGTRKSKLMETVKAFGGGDASNWTNEVNDRITPSAEFYIAAFPVTVMQFRAYLKQNGTEPGDADCLRDPETRPVRFVSWHEAVAYCTWLEGQIRVCQEPAAQPVRALLQLGWRLCLPSELEWEKAVRAGAPAPSSIWWWGDVFEAERVNSGETDVNTTSPVGVYPAAPNGLKDMLGNVWEWTRTRYREGDYSAGIEDDMQDKDELRRLRGGSWDDGQDLARCAARYSSLPDRHLDDVGFRCVLSPAFA